MPTCHSVLRPHRHSVTLAEEPVGWWGGVEANDSFQRQFSVVWQFDDSARSLVKKIFIFGVLVSFVLRTLTLSLSLSLSCTVIGGRRFRPSVAVVEGHGFRPTSGHLELISMFMMLIQQQSEPLADEWNMLETIEERNLLSGENKIFFVLVDAAL